MMKEIFILIIIAMMLWFAESNFKILSWFYNALGDLIHKMV